MFAVRFLKELDEHIFAEYKKHSYENGKIVILLFERKNV
jgi:hypothetical protein